MTHENLLLLLILLPFLGSALAAVLLAAEGRLGARDLAMEKGATRGRSFSSLKPQKVRS